MNVQPYLFFDGRCQEAIDFYRQAVGAEVVMSMKFSDSPDPIPAGMIPPGSENKIMHMQFRVGDSTILASDGNCGSKPAFQGFSLSLTVENDAAADKAFQALVDGGKVEMPLNKTFFSSRFGMLTDRYGVGWMVYVAPKS